MTCSVANTNWVIRTCKSVCSAAGLVVGLVDGAGFVASGDLVSGETVGDSVTEGVGVEL